MWEQYWHTCIAHTCLKSYRRYNKRILIFFSSLSYEFKLLCTFLLQILCISIISASLGVLVGVLWFSKLVVLGLALNFNRGASLQYAEFLNHVSHKLSTQLWSFSDLLLCIAIHFQPSRARNNQTTKNEFLHICKQLQDIRPVHKII